MAGSIEKRGEGRYRLTYSAGTGPGGKRLRYRKTISAKNDREAEKELAKFVAEIEKGQYLEPSKLTLEDFSKRWLRDYAEVNLAPKTIARYKGMLDHHILPAMGHMKMPDIKPLHIIEFENMLREDGARRDGKKGGLSDSTILKYHRLLSSMLNDAVHWQVIKSNPVARVKPPKADKPDIAYYNEEQTAAMLKALEQEPIKYRALVELALATGLRKGELMGLEWQDIDFSAGTLTVERASQYLPEKGVFTKKPKNVSSGRIISLPASTLSLLKRHKVEQNKERLKVGDLWQQSDRLFTTWDGKPMHPDTPYSWFREFQDKHGLPHISFHALRHTSATLLINEGLNVKALSARLGHAETSTTMNIYAKALQSADRAAADMMDGILSQSKHTTK